MSRAAELRAAFDASFAAVPAAPNVDVEDLIAVGAGSRSFLLRLRHIAGLHVDKRIARLPGATPGLLGIAGFRGAAVPVYHLGALLGVPGEATPRWMALARRDDPIALAFERFAGHVRVARSAIARDESGERTGVQREVVRLDGGVQPLVDVEALVAVIVAQARTQEGSRRGR